MYFFLRALHSKVLYIWFLKALNIQGAAAAQAQESQEELLQVQGQEGWLWGDTPRPR